jgi:hypothetical protein
VADRVICAISGQAAGDRDEFCVGDSAKQYGFVFLQTGRQAADASYPLIHLFLLILKVLKIFKVPWNFRKEANHVHTLSPI